MRILTLREGEPARPERLTDLEAAALAGAELAEVTRVPGASTWMVAAGNKVGVVRVGNDLQVVVRPKIPTRRLLFLMGHAVDPTFWRDELVDLPPDDEMASLLAESFRRLVVRTVGTGLLHGYRTIDESSPVLRGRIRVADHLGRHHGRLMPLEITYDEYTPDIAENQILLAAVHALLRLPDVSSEVRRKLQQLRLLFADVTPVAAAAHRPRWRPTRLNARYVPALRLAELILDGDSIEQHGDGSAVQVSGFVLTMWKVYEDFVTAALARELTSRGGVVAPQLGIHLDVGSSVPMRPDIVWTRGGCVQLVADAKYKTDDGSTFKNADIYQLLAYCTALNRRHGHLVYAKGNGEERTVRIKEVGVTIHCHTLDLALEPKALLDQVRRIASSMAAPGAAFSQRPST